MLQIRNLFLIVFIVGIKLVVGQQASPLKPIDFEFFDKRVVALPGNGAAISNDGRYCAYRIANQPYKKATMVLRSTETDWQQSFVDGEKDCFFTSDSRKFIIRVNGNLSIVALKEGTSRIIRSVGRFLHAGTGNKEWLFWQSKNSDTLVAENILTGEVQKFSGVKSIKLNKGENILSILTTNGGLLLFNLTNSKTYKFNSIKYSEITDAGEIAMVQVTGVAGTTLERIDFVQNESFSIWESKEQNDQVQNVKFDSYGATSLAFLVAKKSGSKEIWYLGSNDTQKAVRINYDTVELNKRSHVLAGILTIGDHFFTLLTQEKNQKLSVKSTAVKMDVWSYHDKVFYMNQEKTKPVSNGIVVLDIKIGKLTTLFEGNEYDMILTGKDHAVIRKGMVGDRFWEHKDSIWLINFQTGQRSLLPVKFNGLIKEGIFYLDPSEKYLTYFDGIRGRQYYKYNIETGKEIILSTGVTDWTLGIEGKRNSGWRQQEKNIRLLVVGRIKGSETILIYDDYDLWAVDLSGRKPPRNITRGYGRKNKIILRMVDWAKNGVDLDSNSSILLKAYDETNGDNGFYSLVGGLNGALEKIFMGPYSFDLNDFFLDASIPRSAVSTFAPIKAKDANAWLVYRGSGSEMRNYFFSNDLKTFKQLSDIQPEVGYRHTKTEWVSFKHADGRLNQGVLFKPIDFNPKKKYPLIFNYYEYKSVAINCFQGDDGMSTGNIDIPWFVSRGYLVFTPDITFERGRYSGYSALLAVEAAARFLMQRPYVDGKRMGLSGHSFGGGLTNYIVTHSKIFAAALEGAGSANKISSALQLSGKVGGLESSRLLYSERGAGTNMWEDPKWWTEDISVLRAHKTITPLLILHNKDDGAMPFAQAVEMFTALRRWNKPVWLLQYDGGGHGVGKDPRNVVDFTTRATQFFDHYLMGKPVPKWMAEGIPAYLRGVETGLELTKSP